MGIPLWSLVIYPPKLVILSSYEDGKVGGDSKLIKLLGELEKAGTLFAQSLVF